MKFVIDTSYLGQSFCLWSTKIYRYCLNSWFICSACLFVCRWKAINNLISIFNILSNSFVNFTTDYSLLSTITLSGSSYSFHTLFLNNLANSFTNILLVVVIKYIILDNLLYTTKIISFLTISSNFVIKSTIRCIHSFSSISLAISFLASISILFFILWHKLYLFYFPLYSATNTCQIMNMPGKRNYLWKNSKRH